MVRKVRVVVPYDGPTAAVSSAVASAFDAAWRDLHGDFDDNELEVDLDFVDLSAGTSFTECVSKMITALENPETLGVLDALTERSKFAQAVRALYSVYGTTAVTVSGEGSHTGLIPVFSMYPSYRTQHRTVLAATKELLRIEALVTISGVDIESDSVALGPDFVRRMLLSFDESNVEHILTHIQTTGVHSVALFSTVESAALKTAEAMKRLNMSSSEFTLTTFGSLSESWPADEDSAWVNAISIGPKVAKSDLELVKSKLVPGSLFPLLNNTANVPVLRAALGYDGAMALFRSILSQCGSQIGAGGTCDRERITTGLLGYDKQGLSGQVRFNATTHRVETRDFDVYQMQSTNTEGGLAPKKVAVITHPAGADFRYEKVAALRFGPEQSTNVPVSLDPDFCGDNELRGRTDKLVSDGYNTFKEWSECRPCGPEPSLRKLGTDQLPLCQLCPEGYTVKQDLNDGSFACVQEPNGGLIAVAASVGIALVGCFVVLVMALCKTHKTKKKSKQKIFLANSRAEAEAELASLLFHEVRNPQACLDGHVRLALGDLEQAQVLVQDLEGDSYKERLQTMVNSAVDDLNVALTASDQVASVLDNVLETGRLMSGKATPELRPVDLVQLCNMIPHFVPVRSTLDVQVQLKCPESLWVKGDSHRMRQVLINLLANAVKYTDDGFARLKVTLLAGDQQAGYQGNYDSIAVLFEVEDTGVGIPLEMQETVFNKFAVVKQDIGTGLGLTISSEIVRMLGSKIQVQSPWSPDGSSGTRFYFTLNFERCEAPDSRRMSTDSLWLTKTPVKMASRENLAKRDMPLRILIADDETLNRVTLSRILKRAVANTKLTLEIVQADSGERALEILGKDDDKIFHCCILDQNMNGNRIDEENMTGTETIRAIKDMCSKRHESPPYFIIASGNCLPSHIEQYYECGAEEVWPKPYPKPHMLRNSILENILPTCSSPGSFENKLASDASFGTNNSSKDLSFLELRDFPRKGVSAACVV